MYVQLSNLTFKYDKTLMVLNDLSFDMKQGEIVALLGKSGSGKSTLLRLISGLETPISGCIVIDDTKVFSEALSIPPHQRGVGMVFQDYALFPHLNVTKNIQYGLSHLPKIAREQKADDMLNLIDLKEKKHNYPHELSGGQQQRIALARALAPEPKILLLDEPFSNLDYDLKKMIRYDLKRILKSRQIATIFATHDYEDALDIADRIVYIENGQIIKEEHLKQTEKNT
ncbi:MAG: ABC transporter ATP-binding protein [Acholeplasmataceae bacterium]|jgi:iron(III) transport system ATP-binding protein